MRRLDLERFFREDTTPQSRRNILEKYGADYVLIHPRFASITNDVRDAILDLGDIVSRDEEFIRAVSARTK